MKTLLVMAGGTGGHIYPGLAVADALAARGWKVLWLGHPQGMEARLVPSRGYPLIPLEFEALRGKGLLRKLLLPINLLRGFWRAWRHLGQVRPDVVIGLGGYVTFPGGMMAVLRGIPLVLHEQNSIPGLANRVLAKVASRVLTGFPNVLGDQATWVGNPVRQDLSELPLPAQRFAGRSGRLRILVVGGSLGAQALNQVVPQALALLAPALRPWVVHQAGEKQLPALQAHYAAAGVEGELLPFIHDMAAQYAAADLVICRAGALTIAELAAVGVGSILVPYPHAVDDHQTTNAAFLADHQAAIIWPQTRLTPEALARHMAGLDREHLLQMAQRARQLAQVHATATVADVCQQLAQ
jgi:UDP-N-acetylglucosamine--N-acetylmuramyl-(pentapeptide) pyrophosphoryl-undecaprenol N-acetylglucosamine transferase